MDYDFAILGAGASGLLTARAICEHPGLQDHRILLIDKEDKNTNDRTWCFWEEGTGPFDSLLERQWERIRVAGPDWETDRTMAPFRYKMLRSAPFYADYRQRLSDSGRVVFWKAGVQGVEESPDSVRVRTDLDEVRVGRVLSSIPLTDSPPDFGRYPLILQHFVGWFVRMDRPVFDPASVTFMDFSVPQQGNTRFMYILPLSDRRALVEYTLFSPRRLAHEEYEAEIRSYLSDRFPGAVYEIEEKEMGSIPMTCYPFWESATDRIIPIGIQGGWAKASSGYTFARSVRESRRLAEYLASGRPPGKFRSRDRFWFYDLLLLDVLHRENQLGSDIFLSLFKKRSTAGILRFLDEQSDLPTEISMMAAPQSLPFIKALLRRVVKGW